MKKAQETRKDDILPDKSAIQAEAAEAVVRVIHDLFTLCSIDVEPSRDALEKICRKYGWDRYYDESLPFTFFRDEAVRIGAIVHKAANSLDDMSERCRSFLEQELRGSGVEDETLFIPNLIASARMLCVSVDSLGKFTGKKEANTRINSGCSRLKKLREHLSGGSFIRNLAAAIGNGSATTNFKSADAQFVLVALKAIDPTVTFSQVRSGLKTTLKQERDLLKRQREK